MTSPSRNLLVVDPHAERYATRLRARFPAVDVLAATAFETAEPLLADAQILVTIGDIADGVEFTRAHAQRMPRLEWVQCLISGSAHIVRAVADRPRVLVTSATGIHGPQVSELAIFHMLALSRNARRLLRNQDAGVWDRLEQRVLDGKTAGIVGLGTIGRQLAPLCRAFGMTVHGLSRSGQPVEGVDRMFVRDELLRFAAGVDFLVLLVPEAPDTIGMIDAAVLARMRPTAHLVNLARGRVVDESALIEALDRGELAGAGLDVFAVEPLPPDSPLWARDDVLVTPHIGGLSDRYIEGALGIVEHNVDAYLRGGTADLLNVVAR